MIRRLMVWVMARFSAFDPATVERWKAQEQASVASTTETRHKNAMARAFLGEREEAPHDDD